MGTETLLRFLLSLGINVLGSGSAVTCGEDPDPPDPRVAGTAPVSVPRQELVHAKVSMPSCSGAAAGAVSITISSAAGATAHPLYVVPPAGLFASTTPGGSPLAPGAWVPALVLQPTACVAGPGGSTLFEVDLDVFTGNIAGEFEIDASMREDGNVTTFLASPPMVVD